MECKIVNIINSLPGKNYEGEDLWIETSESLSNQSELEYLVFTDSKGKRTEEKGESCFISLLTDYLKKHNISYLVIGRPKELTTFFTLINFLNSCDYHFKNLITNVGFVDFTPKKKEVILDHLLQKPAIKHSDEIKLIKLSKFKLSTGGYEHLYSIDMSNKMKKEIAQALKKHFKQTFLIPTFEIEPNQITNGRIRPSEFFVHLKKTNQFLSELSETDNINLMEIKENSVSEHNPITFDGVHLMQPGHLLIFKTITHNI